MTKSLKKKYEKGDNIGLTAPSKDKLSIKKLRGQLEWSKERMAHVLNIDADMYDRIESGTQCIPNLSLRCLKNLLGVEYEEILLKIGQENLGIFDIYEIEKEMYIKAGRYKTPPRDGGR